MLLISLLSQMLSTPPSESANSYFDADCWTVTLPGQAPENAESGAHLKLIRPTSEGLLVPLATGREILWRLKCLELWPQMAQIKLNEQRALADFDFEVERRLVLELQTEALKPPPKPSLWDRFGWHAVTFGIGMLAGGAILYLLVH